MVNLSKNSELNMLFLSNTVLNVHIFRSCPVRPLGPLSTALTLPGNDTVKDKSVIIRDYMVVRRLIPSRCKRLGLTFILDLSRQRELGLERQREG